MSARVKRRRRQKQLERAIWQAHQQRWRASEEAVGYYDALRRWVDRRCIEALQPVPPGCTLVVYRVPTMG